MYDKTLPRIFSSFIQGGFECSTHRRRDGKRLDLIEATQHDRFLKADYERLKGAGIRTVREGLRWHLIEASRGVYDFSSLTPAVAASNEAGIQVIWDLFHFGWPDHLDIFHPAWVEAFGELAWQFARLWKRESGDRQAYISPVNEISFVSWAGGDRGFFNPFAEGRGSELKTQLVRGALRAVQALRSELPTAVIVSPEPVIHIAGDAARPEDVAEAEAYRLSMFEAWDMMSGRLCPELGGQPGSFDVIGINYYDRNQWFNHGPTIRPGEPAYRPFHLILKEVFERYRCPLFIAETGTEDDARPAWFAYVASEVRRAIELGVPVHGICVYPVVNHPGWDDDRHCCNGLWDYAGPDGSRAIYAPLADEIRKQEEIRLAQEKRNDP